MNRYTKVFSSWKESTRASVARRFSEELAEARAERERARGDAATAANVSAAVRETTTRLFAERAAEGMLRRLARRSSLDCLGGWRRATEHARRVKLIVRRCAVKMSKRRLYAAWDGWARGVHTRRAQSIIQPHLPMHHFFASIAPPMALINSCFSMHRLHGMLCAARIALSLLTRILL